MVTASESGFHSPDDINWKPRPLTLVMAPETYKAYDWPTPTKKTEYKYAIILEYK